MGLLSNAGMEPAIRDYIHVQDCKTHVKALEYLQRGGKMLRLILGSEKVIL